MLRKGHILAIFVIVVSVITVPAFAQEMKIYENSQFGFVMNYPANWTYEETLLNFEGTDYIVSFYDDIEGWNSYFEINFTPDYTGIQTGTDQQWLNALNLGYKQACESASYEVEGYICTNHSLIDSRIIYIDEKKSYQLTYSWLETLEDSTEYENISISTIIPDGFNMWSIYSESLSDVFPNYKDEIISSINSFNSIKSIRENVQSSSFRNEGNIFFQEDIFSFVDLSKRPMSVITPREITNEWYANTKHDFAIKFPSSWKDDWSLNENFQGYKIAEFTSKTTEGKILFFLKDDKNLAQSLLTSDKDRLYQEAKKMVTETSSRFQGFFQVDVVSVVKFRDGLAVGATFFEIDENENHRLYDVTYIIHEGGKIFEIIYYGDNFSAIDYNDYSLMFDRFYIGDISEIPAADKETVTDLGMYVNDEFGFSFVPPKGWEHLELNTQFEASSLPLELNAITSFTVKDFQGVFPPQLVIAYVDLGQTIKLEGPDDEEFLQGAISGFKDTLEQTGTFEVTDSKIEHFENSAKATIEGILKIDIDGMYVPRHLEVVIWMFENGEAYYFILGVDPDDYESRLQEFRNSINTIAFKPKPEPTVVPTSPESPNGGGCLIASALFGSELSPQVQQLRELRDNHILKTESGSTFMTGFNQFYYSFSPTIADWERQSPIFKEAVKLTITPMITSLSLLNHVEMDSEAKVLGYGISLIILNIGMYVVVPVRFVFMLLKRKQF